jgi:hypothetical protein
MTIMLFCAAMAFSAEPPVLKGPPKNAAPVFLAALSFDKDSLGKPPADFVFAVTGEGPAARWEVQQDPSISTLHHLLVQTGHTEPGDNAALALLHGSLLEHGEVVVRFRVNGGEDDQSAGIVWRYQDPQTYYMARASAKDDACSVYLVKKGKRKLLDTQQVVIIPYTWHELRVVFVQKSYSVFIDHELIVGGKNSGLPGAGQIGLCTLSDSVVRFDDFRYSR